MATDPDGVLTVTFDPARNLVTLLVLGSAWTGTVPDQVTLTRKVGSAAPVVVRGADRATAPGGTLVWSDNEAPLDAAVTYTATGYRFGSSVGSVSVQIETEGAEWGVWVKVPGRPEQTVLATVKVVGDQSRETLGGFWQIPGGPTISQSGSGALAQSAGMGALSTTLELTTYDMGTLEALERTVRTAPGQTLLLQTGQPEELASGYYFVQSMSRTNPSGLRSDLHAMRHVTLSVVEAAIPAGPASGWTGVTYADIYEAFPTYQDIVDAEMTYMDLATGAWS